MINKYYLYLLGYYNYNNTLTAESFQWSMHPNHCGDVKHQGVHVRGDYRLMLVTRSTSAMVAMSVAYFFACLQKSVLDFAEWNIPV